MPCEPKHSQTSFTAGAEVERQVRQFVVSELVAQGWCGTAPPVRQLVADAGRLAAEAIAATSDGMVAEACVDDLAVRLTVAASTAPGAERRREAHPRHDRCDPAGRGAGPEEVIDITLLERPLVEVLDLRAGGDRSHAVVTVDLEIGAPVPIPR
jgi:hypothetical protein